MDAANPTTTRAPAVPRRASTLLLLRDGAAGLEVLMLRRAERSGDRSSGAWVFPGGTLDARDGEADGCCAGLDDAAASERLALPERGLDHYVAAMRECFEEAGVLLALDAAWQPVAPDAARWAPLRRALRAGELDAAGLCRALGVRLAADRLAYHSHWLTPAGVPKRFDTRFFVAEMPAGQVVTPDGIETLEHRWVRPAQAADAASGLRLPNATRRTLLAIADFPSAAACVAHAREQAEVRRILPVLADGPKGLAPVHPGEPGYAEILRLDPHGTGSARYVIEAGRAVVLSPRIRRVTAPNPGMMTGPGTNTYLVGDPERNDWAVIDPGPDDASHLEAIVAAAPGPIRWILVTHTHRDHSPGAAALAARTGAPRLGRAAPPHAGQDVDFRPERELAHGERLELGPDATLRVIHTPGHASNHLCYLLEEERLLFTGDHVMQGSTVVINPPDGDMGQYLASLEALLAEPLEWLAPGHGFLVDAPHAVIETLIRHRRAREAKVRQAVEALGRDDDLDALVARVYDDVPAARHEIAKRSLLAHLIELRRARA